MKHNSTLETGLTHSPHGHRQHEVFVAHSSRDRVSAMAIVDALEAQGVSCWIAPRDVPAGEFAPALSEAIKTARVFVVLVSSAADQSPDVRNELALASSHRRTILPVRLHGASAPHLEYYLAAMHAIDAPRGLNPDVIAEVAARVSKELATGDSRRDRFSLVVGGQRMRLPLFVRSVSSFETVLAPESALDALDVARQLGDGDVAEAVLVSAYDLAPKRPRSDEIRRGVQKLLDAGVSVVLDSGNYECSRRRDKGWNRARFLQIAREVPANLVFSFDNTRPPTSQGALIDDVVAGVERDASSLEREVAPIVHVPRDISKTNRTVFVVEVMHAVASRVASAVVAIPERELGDGIIERARTVRAIRAALDELPTPPALHLLGTGNPISIAIFAAAGADMFDGLEWCRTAADYTTSGLAHHQHLDILTWAARYESDLMAKILDGVKPPFYLLLALHNLEFFRVWMKQIREHLERDRIDQFLAAKLPGAMPDLRRALPEVLR